MEFFVNQFQVFLLIMARLAGMFFLAPLYSSQSVRFGQKMILAFFVTMVCFPMVEKFRYPVPEHTLEFIIYLLLEALFGILIGFIVSLIVTSFQMAGQFFSTQVGFGMSEVLDPMSQTSIPVVGTLLNLVGLFVFLIIGGHLLIVRAVIYSFEKINLLVLNETVNTGLLRFFESTFGAMFIVALKMALPVIGTLFLISLTMGLLAKAAPQMNILMLGFPVNIMVTFAVMIILSPILTYIMRDSFILIFDKLDQLQGAWPRQ